ncbi:hypothetical protein C2E23DRAFT_883901 [Lenzites betulinus]|nr:hypothetical protein C2E23DRAFT_883901 [Lenzites betulinus]
MGNPDKFRLYLAMYDNGKLVAPGDPPQIHWALMVGPKFEEPLSLLKTNVLYHATNRTRGGHWEFERREVECVRSRSMLGRILLGKVEQYDWSTVELMLGDRRRIGNGEQGWDCWVWIEGALIDLLHYDVLRLQNRGGIDLRHLKDYGRALCGEIIREGLDRGDGIPVTVDYPGPGPIPSKILK